MEHLIGIFCGGKASWHLHKRGLFDDLGAYIIGAVDIYGTSALSNQTRKEAMDILFMYGYRYISVKAYHIVHYLSRSLLPVRKILSLEFKRTNDFLSM